MQLLNSIGLLLLEFHTPSGEMLEMPLENTMNITVPIATSTGNNYPNEVPLWFFNEKKQTWEADGTATKMGNTYQANVPQLRTGQLLLHSHLSRFPGKL